MDRRSFVKLGALASAQRALPLRAQAKQDPLPANLTIAEGASVKVPIDFTGVSFESPQLYNPRYYSAENTTLVQAFRDLSAHGVLRAGGHLSDVSRWNGPNGDFSDPKQDAGIVRGKSYWEWKLTDPSVRDTKDGAITPEAIENLKGFLDATNWKLIYGLNFGSGSRERAADEARFVANTMGDRLIAFQIGNESDQFAGMPFFRQPPYGLPQYLEDVQGFMQAVLAAVPGAKFGGPDTATNLRWLQGFAEAHAPAVTFLSSHFYAMGPAKDPAMNASFLLGPNERLAKQFAAIPQAVAAGNGKPYRMTEGNSCFGGGKPGVSDGFASALWGADYMLQCAQTGYAGVNLHGGGDGYYTAIAVGPNLSTERRPLFFGMQFADRFAGAQLHRSTLQTRANASAYLGEQGQRTLVGVINKDPRPIRLQLPQELAHKKLTTAQCLSAPALEATSGVSFTANHSAVRHGAVEVPGYTGILLSFS